MLEITIKDTETGKVLERTTKLAVICANGDGGIHGLTLGRGDSTELATLALALDGVRDGILEKSKNAKALYLLKDMAGPVTKISGLTVDCFSDR